MSDFGKHDAYVGNNLAEYIGPGGVEQVEEEQTDQDQAGEGEHAQGQNPHPTLLPSLAIERKAGLPTGGKSWQGLRVQGSRKGVMNLLPMGLKATTKVALCEMSLQTCVLFFIEGFFS
jgi:hypothetical protein